MPVQLHAKSLDAPAEYSPYAEHQIEQRQLQEEEEEEEARRLRNFSTGANPVLKQHHRQGTSNDSARDGGSRTTNEGIGLDRTSGQQSVRRRISRACDQCNQLRTKCDGKNPCAHCVEAGLSCEYARARKKRGKASRKDIAAAVAATAAAEAVPPPNSSIEHAEEASSEGAGAGMSKSVKRKRSSATLQALPIPVSTGTPCSTQPSFASVKMPLSGSVTSQPLKTPDGIDRSLQSSHPVVSSTTQGVALPTPRLPSAVAHERGLSMGAGEYGSIDDYHRSVLHPAATVMGHNILHSGPSAIPQSLIHSNSVPGYGDSQYSIPSPNSQHGTAVHSYPLRESPLPVGLMGQSPTAGSPGWLSLPSPTSVLFPHLQNLPSTQSLRYPVLRPLVPHISAIIPISLACDLLELYFSSTSSVVMHSQSPYVLASVFRKRSFLRQSNPRTCSPALLASMLWIAAQTSESAFLSSSPSARGKTCQKLLELTVGLLKPLVHTPSDGSRTHMDNPVANGSALGGFGLALAGPAHDMEGGTPGASGSLDDIATYIHLATVVSASEYKGASLRWWHAAWTLARELKLGREQPPNLEPPDSERSREKAQVGSESDLARPPSHVNHPGSISEEEREERRRIWWLLYIVDRHTALCYNRPLALLDVECDGLMQPDDDETWQVGDFYPGGNHAESAFFRRRGPCFECTGLGFYDSFLPIMTILGGIVDLKHAQSHPRFGPIFRGSAESGDQVTEILNQLEAYGRSLRDFEERNMGVSAPNQFAKIDTRGVADTPPPYSAQHQRQHQHQHQHQRLTEMQLQTKIVVAYSTHLLHTMRILVTGKWDPISLLDDNDLWISSPSFVAATGNAVAAAAAVDDILDLDPDLSRMPWFFGIYLLQASFLLLLIADKFQAAASPAVAKACETIVRAHEACVVTLNTEYQRNFRNVMRSALAQVRGRCLPGDFGEQQQLRRREVLNLYRWTGDGTGLAL